MSRREMSGLVAAVAAVLLCPRAASASPIADLRDSNDFRVRMSAALLVGRAKVAGGRVALEQALRDEHPAVRAAAASGLVEFGDAAASKALRAQAAVESHADVRTTLLASVDKLSVRASAARAQYIVQVGAMRNLTDVRSGELQSVLRGATRSVAMDRLHNAAIVDESERKLPQNLSRLPMVRLDGQLRSLLEQKQQGQLTVHAKVEFAVLRKQALKATMSGSATAGGSVKVGDEDALFRLHKRAIENAVVSAMGSAEAGVRSAL